MTGAVKELAEIHVEVFKEGLHAVDVRKRNPQVAAIFFGPLFEPENLRVAQTGAKRLTGLKVFVRHRAPWQKARLKGLKADCRDALRGAQSPLAATAAKSAGACRSRRYGDSQHEVH